MNIKLARDFFGPACTFGKLYVDDRYECETLEDVVRPAGVKIPGETAIPFGRYKVVIDFSQRFQRMMLHVLDVPMFEGVRIHKGNTVRDTEGCVLVGLVRSGAALQMSAAAFQPLFDKVHAALGQGQEVWLEIVSATDGRGFNA